MNWACMAWRTTNHSAITIFHSIPWIKTLKICLSNNNCHFMNYYHLLLRHLATAATVNFKTVYCNHRHVTTWLIECLVCSMNWWLWSMSILSLITCKSLGILLGFLKNHSYQLFRTIKRVTEISKISHFTELFQNVHNLVSNS